MSDLDSRLDKIEQQLQLITHNQASVSPAYAGIYSNQVSSQKDEIDLLKMCKVLWEGKWWVIGITFLFAVVGVFYALSLPNVYRSEGVYTPVQSQVGGGLASQYGGLASLAGIDLSGGGNNDIEQAMELVNSWPFLEGVIEKNNLKPLIMGVKGWDKNNNSLIWNEDIYDPAHHQWLDDSEESKLAEPSSFDVYMAFLKMLNVKFDSKNSMIRVSVEYYSPELAKEWVDLIVSNINETFRNRDMGEAKDNIDYLKNKINETSIAGMQSVFYNMVETQTQTLMLAEVNKSYLIKAIVEPKPAELKSSPKRLLIVFLSIVIGGFLSSIMVFSRYFYSVR